MPIVARAFYFDVGGVLIEDKFGDDAFAVLRNIALRLRGDPERAYNAYTAIQPSLDSGDATLTDFCAAAQFDQKLFERVWLALHPIDSKALYLLERLLVNGERVGLATNFCRELLNLVVEETPLLARLLICCSSDVGFVKPSEGFFRVATEMIFSHEIIFVDDRPVNLRAAHEIGWTTVPVAPDWVDHFAKMYCDG